MTRTLVTGATGQDGSYLVERLLADGEEVVALVRDETPAGEQSLRDGVATVVGDLADIESLTRAVSDIEPDAVVNLAGISSVAKSWEEPVLTGQVSGVAVAALLSACRRLGPRGGAGVRFVQASSAEIFGDAAISPQDESTPQSPNSPYGAAKAYAHNLVRAFREGGMHASAAILYNHESPRRPTTFVTRKITRAAAEIARGRTEPLMLGDRSARRDWGWAPDYVDGLLRMLRADEPGDYVLATGEAHSVDDFVAAAFRAAGIDDWTGMVGTDPRFLRPVETPLLVGDATKARQQLGWRAAVGFDELVRRMVEADLSAIDAGD